MIEADLPNAADLGMLRLDRGDLASAAGTGF